METLPSTTMTARTTGFDARTTADAAGLTASARPTRIYVDPNSHIAPEDVALVSRRDPNRPPVVVMVRAPAA